MVAISYMYCGPYVECRVGKSIRPASKGCVLTANANVSLVAGGSRMTPVRPAVRRSLKKHLSLKKTRWILG